MKLSICSLLILAVFDGRNCAPSPQEQYGIRGHEVRFNFNPKLTAALALGQRKHDGLFVIQPEINPSLEGSAGYFKSWLPPPGYYGYQQNQLPQQYPNYQQIPYVPQNQLSQQYRNYQQIPYVPQNQLPQQYPIYQQNPNVPQSQLPQQYPNQPNTFDPQNQDPIQSSNHQNPDMPQYQPNQYPSNSESPIVPQYQLDIRQDKISSAPRNIKV